MTTDRWQTEGEATFQQIAMVPPPEGIRVFVVDDEIPARQRLTARI